MMVKNVKKRLIIGLIILGILSAGSIGFVSGKEDMGADAWVKISGVSEGYEGVTDGIDNTRENSYAWAMEVFDGYLWVGTNRNIFGTMFAMGGMPTIGALPDEIPNITDMRPGIYRMDLSTEEWETFYVPDAIPQSISPLPMGIDLGYRMMKTYEGGNGEPVLYVGSLGYTTSLIAIDGEGEMNRVFTMTGQRLLSIRGIAEHEGKLFWATEDTSGMGMKATPALWYDEDPLGAYLDNPGVEYAEIPVPDEWLGLRGAEVLDMVSYNGALYVFFLPYEDDEGFWCGKLTMAGDEYEWELIVGDEQLGAAYPAGMGSPFNGGAVPIVFKNKVYVGTMDGAAFRLMNGISQPAPGDLTMGGTHGMQIYRFGSNDKWEHVMPKHNVRDEETLTVMNGFENPYNKYIWRFGIQKNRLYAGTFDIGTGTQVISAAFGMAAPTLPTPPGFDMYWTIDGEKWREVTSDGFGDKFNYGTRAFVTDPATDTLYMGTANPFYGCQIWKKPA
jgi:hypothetical protein